MRRTQQVCCRKCRNSVPKSRFCGVCGSSLPSRIPVTRILAYCALTLLLLASIYGALHTGSLDVAKGGSGLTHGDWLVDAQSYVIFNDGGTYKARDGATGEVTSDADPATLVQGVVDDVSSAAVLYLKGKGETWPWSAPVTVNSKNISIISEPTLQAVANYPGPNTEMFFFMNVSDIDVVLRLDGNKSNQGGLPRPEVGVRFYACSDVRATIHSVNQPNADVSMWTDDEAHRCENMRLNLYSLNCDNYSGSGYSLYLSGGLGIHVSGYVEGSVAQPLYLEGTYGTEVWLNQFKAYNCATAGTVPGLDVRSGTTAYLTDVEMDTINNDGVHVYAGGAVYGHNVTIKGATQYGVENYGLLVVDGLEIDATGGNHALMTRGGSDYAFVSHFIVTGVETGTVGICVNADSAGDHLFRDGSIAGVNGFLDQAVTKSILEHVDLSGVTGTKVADAGAGKVRDCNGYVTKNTVTVTITAGNTTSGNVPHLLAATPTNAWLTPTSDTGGKRWWLSSKDGTSIVVSIDSAYVSNITFDCEVEV